MLITNHNYLKADGAAEDRQFVPAALQLRQRQMFQLEFWGIRAPMHMPYSNQIGIIN
jgi:hypothetical protein